MNVNSSTDIKLNPVRPVLPAVADIAEQFDECLASGMVSNNSKYVEQFEERLASFLQLKEAPVTFCNGEMALYNLLLAWKRRLGVAFHDSFDVLIPSLTFVGTANAVVAANLRPVFCDVDDTLTLSVDKLKGAQVGDDVKMVLAVGAHGNPPNYEALRHYAKDCGFQLLCDNAPAFGSRYKGQLTTTLDVDEIYSLHATKILSSMEGGIAVSHDSQVREYLRRLRNFGQIDVKTGNVDMPGLNAKMQEISAIVGLKNLVRYDEILQSRLRVVAHIESGLAPLFKSGSLKNMVVPQGNTCTYWYYPVVLENECSEFVHYLQEHKILARRYYTAVHKLDYYRDKYRRLDLTNTDNLCDRTVCLPVYSDMRDEEMDYLVSTVIQFFEG